MTKTRIYISDIAKKEDTFSLSKENLKILKSVIRLKKGDCFEAVDGGGCLAICVIDTLKSGECLVKIKDRNIHDDEGKPKITLLQAFPKGKRIDFVIQKCVELGIDRMIFFPAKRSVSIIKKNQFENKRDRFEKIAIEALRQCKRLYLPRIDILSGPKSCAKEVENNELKLCLHEDQEGTRLKSWLDQFSSPKSICFSIGPEGGFTESEVIAFVSAGFKQVKLGEEVLRTETAPISVLSVLDYLYRW